VGWGGVGWDGWGGVGVGVDGIPPAIFIVIGWSRLGDHAPAPRGGRQVQQQLPCGEVLEVHADGQDLAG